MLRTGIMKYVNHGIPVRTYAKLKAVALVLAEALKSFKQIK